MKSILKSIHWNNLWPSTCIIRPSIFCNSHQHMITDCSHKSHFLRKKINFQGKYQFHILLSKTLLYIKSFIIVTGEVIIICFPGVCGLAKPLLLFNFLFTFSCFFWRVSKRTCKRHKMSHPSTKDFSWDGTSECKLPSFLSAQNKD